MSLFSTGDFIQDFLKTVHLSCFFTYGKGWTCQFLGSVRKVINQKIQKFARFRQIRKSNYFLKISLKNIFLRRKSTIILFVRCFVNFTLIAVHHLDRKWSRPECKLPGCVKFWLKVLLKFLHRLVWRNWGLGQVIAASLDGTLVNKIQLFLSHKILSS